MERVKNCLTVNPTQELRWCEVSKEMQRDEGRLSGSQSSSRSRSAKVTVPMVRPRSLRSCKITIFGSAVYLERWMSTSVSSRLTTQRRRGPSSREKDSRDWGQLVYAAKIPPNRLLARLHALEPPKATWTSPRKSPSSPPPSEAYLPRNATREAGDLDLESTGISASPAPRVRVVRRATRGLTVPTASAVTVISVAVASSAVASSSTSSATSTIVAVVVAKAAGVAAVRRALAEHRRAEGKRGKRTQDESEEAWRIRLRVYSERKGSVGPA